MDSWIIITFKKIKKYNKKVDKFTVRHQEVAIDDPLGGFLTMDKFDLL